MHIRHVSSVSVVAIVGLAAPCRADTVEVFANTGQRNVPWTDTIELPQFSRSFARLEGVDYSFESTVRGRASVRNLGEERRISVGFTNYRMTVESPASVTFPDVNVITGGASVAENFTTGQFRAMTAINNGAAMGAYPGSETHAFQGSGTMVFTLDAPDAAPYVSPGDNVDISSTDFDVLGGVKLTYHYTDIGLTQSDPILPTGSGADGAFLFEGVPSGRWFDPDSATGYLFEMLSDGDRFTQILAFPTGFAPTMSVRSGDTDLGVFMGGDGLMFSGAGVRSFVVTGLNPATDPDDPLAFPIQLGFDGESASFSMTAIPEPSCVVLLGLGTVCTSLCARRVSGHGRF